MYFDRKTRTKLGRMDKVCRKEELNFEPTLNIQAGLRMGRENSQALRLAIDQTWGEEERGSFMNNNRNFARLGLYLDF